MRHLDTAPGQWPTAKPRRKSPAHARTFDGKTLREWSQETGLSMTTVQRRYQRGESLELPDLRTVNPQPPRTLRHGEVPSDLQPGCVSLWTALVIEIHARKASGPTLALLAVLVPGITRSHAYRLIRVWNLAHGREVKPGADNHPGLLRHARHARLLVEAFRGPVHASQVQAVLPELNRASSYRYASALRIAYGVLPS